MFLAASLVVVPKAGLCYSGGLTKAEANQVVSLRQAGLTGDTSQIQAMRDIVKNPYATNAHTFAPSVDELLVTTALRALTRLNATEAISDIDLLVQNTKQHYPGLANFATVQSARLKAEQVTATDSNFQARLSNFYHALGLTPSEINTGAAKYRKQYYASPEGRRLPLPVEIYAMREVAEMIYTLPLQSSMESANVLGLDFSLDAPSKLKVRLASMPPPQRISTLVDDTTSTVAMSETQDYQLQLLLDNRSSASQVIMQQIKLAEQNETAPSSQENHERLANLIRELGDTGDKNLLSIVSEHISSPDNHIGSEAKLATRRLEAEERRVIPAAAGY